MCGSDAPDPPPPPATPPPPPPVLEQAAPDSTAKKETQTVQDQAIGTSKYRNSLSIAGSSGTTGSSTGLGISM